MSKEPKYLTRNEWVKLEVWMRQQQEVFSRCQSDEEFMEIAKRPAYKLGSEHPAPYGSPVRRAEMFHFREMARMIRNTHPIPVLLDGP